MLLSSDACHIFKKLPSNDSRKEAGDAPVTLFLPSLPSIEVLTFALTLTLATPTAGGSAQDLHIVSIHLHLGQ